MKANELKKLSVDFDYLSSWYLSSIDGTVQPIWTEAHIKEILGDFYLIPKQEEV